MKIPHITTDYRAVIYDHKNVDKIGHWKWSFKDDDDDDNDNDDDDDHDLARARVSHIQCDQILIFLAIYNN